MSWQEYLLRQASRIDPSVSPLPGSRPHDLEFVGSGRAMDADRGGSDTTAQKAMEEFRRYAETYGSKQGV